MTVELIGWIIVWLVALFFFALIGAAVGGPGAAGFMIIVAVVITIKELI